MIAHRRDIDGLRSIAILPVLAYHANSSWMPGGFVGVDIFFVISGFLITSIIYRDMMEGSFSIKNFYERRARRILPALFFMLAVVLMLGWVMLLPTFFSELATASLFSISFLSNVFFWNEIGYFSTAAEYWPLIHTWSLSVEEQFYLLFPLGLLVLTRLQKPAALKVAIIGVVVASFFFCLVGTYRYPSATFYLLPTRFWELGVGAMIALGVVKLPDSRTAREWSAGFGALLIVLSLILYSEEVGFPGWWALLPVLGSALVISSGDQTRLAVVLSSAPLVLVGMVSYSLYLWHWPILAFARHLNGSINLPFGWLVMCILLSFGAAFFSWRYIEEPFRTKGKFSGSSALAVAIASAAVLVFCSSVVLKGKGLPSRWSEGELNVAGSIRDFEQHKACWGRLPVEHSCRLGAAGPKPTVLVWGDSHAGALIPAFDHVLKSQGLAGIVATHGSCPPLLGVTKGEDRQSQSCNAFNNEIASWLESGEHSISQVVFVARWNVYATGTRVPGEPGKSIVLSRADKADMPREDIFEFGLLNTVELIRGLGIPLTIVEDLPEIGWNVPLAVPVRSRLGLGTPVAPTLETVVERSVRANETLEKSKKLGVSIISLTGELCAPSCSTIIDGNSVYADDNHIPVWGAENILAPMLSKKIHLNRVVVSDDGQP